ncbi:hypothetical protein L915_05544 [Phytophthora nicotianae]|uniref:AAA+ ATPase domain-containing protein n=1 Tax=Phytophthora nicotianae TaxID=4792 RepID=W2H640_PHYNI|nr:hypothetical protein L915_05544 [Phytophthora nicotianae]
MDAEGGGVKKRKTEASAMLRKKPRRSARDKSEFVSVEVGMREFKKRLAASGSNDADTADTAAGANTVEDLTQDVKKTRTRAKPKTEVKKVTTRKTAPRTTTQKATASEKKMTVKKTPVKRTTRSSSKMTLAEVKAQLEREQKDRVEYRIQTLRRDTKPTAVPASSVSVGASAVTAAPGLAAPVDEAPSSAPVAPALAVPVALPVQIQASAVVSAQHPMEVTSTAPATVMPSLTLPATIENHTQSTQAYTSTTPAPPTANLSVNLAPVSTAVPPSNPVKNEFIADDVEEDLMFAMALEEVERKLATPQKQPPSSKAVVATNSLPSVSHQAPAVPAKPTPVEQKVEVQPTQTLNASQPQPTETLMDIKQAELAVVLAPDVLEEMERLRRENELLRRSNELLQAAVTPPAHPETRVDEQPRRSPDRSTAHDRKIESTVSLEDTSARSIAQYLDLARCDSDQNMKQTAYAKIPDRTIDMNSPEKRSGNAEPNGEDNSENITNEEKKIHEGEHKPTEDTEAVAEHQIHTENVSQLSTAVTSQAESQSTPLPDHSTPSEKDDHSPTRQIAIEQEADGKYEVVLREKEKATKLSPSKEKEDEHSVHATAGSDGDVSDVSMSEHDGEEEEEEDPMGNDDSAPRTSTIDIGNYAEYKVHQQDELEAGEDECIEERSDDVSEDKMASAPAPLTPVDLKPCERVIGYEANVIQKPHTSANSENLERTTAPSNSEDYEEDGGEDEEELMVVNRVKRREVMAISSSSSSSESDSEIEEDAADDTPSSNVLEAALKAAGSDFGRKNQAKAPSTTTRDRRESKATLSGGASVSSPAVPVKSKKRRTPGLSPSTAKKPPSVKSSLLWPELDEFYDFLLDLSPRNVRRSEKKRTYLEQYVGGKIPTQHLSIEDYCNVQLEAIMEELVASVSNTTDRRGGGGSGPIRHLSLASVSPCGTQGMSTPTVGLSLGAIFSESGFTGNTSNSNDYILTFDASGLGKKASSDFMSGDLVLLRSPRWKNYEMCVFGVILCDSVVAVGGKNGPGGKSGGGESDQICVLIRVQPRDRDDAVENFGVLTELCLSNQRAPNWRWSMQQVHNTTTSAREFQAIKAISFFPNDLKQVLLSGQLVSTTRAEKRFVPSSSMISPRLLKYLQKHYNDSQVQAILGCLGEDSRVIIQGPPGTGKTKTILGLLSALLDGAGLSTLQKAKGTARIRVGASLQNARTSAVSKTVAETSIRILVAAPSNAAVDELVLRVLSEGLYDGEKGESYRPRIVRVGRPESQQLSSLAAAREASESKKNRKKMRKYAREVEEVLLESLVTKHRSTFPTVKQARQAIIKNAQIVFCTLSGAGSVAMCEFAQDFDALIIDEAAQAVEASTLIPFKFRPHRVVLVGDHRQLPATVISKNLVSMGYDRSLQQRLVENGSPVLLLNQQYRMHPEISEFPSKFFYEGKLVQDDNMREWTAQDYHRDRAFKPLLFLDVQGAQSQVSGSTSLRNMSEVEAVIQLVRRLLTKSPRIEWKKRIGVIAPYKQQIYEVRGAIGKLEAEFDRHLGIEVNTVDGFQGREKEIIIYSCVRTSYGGRRKQKKRSRGNDEEDVLDAFWADERRMNVAITRAKSSLWIVGNSTLLKQSRAWRALIQHTKDHKRYVGDGATLFASSSSTRKISKASSKSKNKANSQ